MADTHKCNKEKEIAVMTIKVENIEKNVDETKKDVKELHTKMDGFIETSNKTYATKDELKTEIGRIEQSKTFLRENWDKIIYMIALLVIGMIAMGDKL